MSPGQRTSKLQNCFPPRSTLNLCESAGGRLWCHLQVTTPRHGAGVPWSHGQQGMAWAGTLGRDDRQRSLPKWRTSAHCSRVLWKPHNMETFETVTQHLQRNPSLSVSTAVKRPRSIGHGPVCRYVHEMWTGPTATGAREGKSSLGENVCTAPTVGARTWQLGDLSTGGCIAAQVGGETSVAGNASPAPALPPSPPAAEHTHGKRRPGHTL